MNIDFNANYFIDLDELHNNLLNDFCIENTEKCLDSCENLGIELGMFNDICSIFEMEKIDIVPLDERKNINKNDKYIVETMNLDFYSTNKNFEKELKKLAEKMYKKIIEKIENEETKDLFSSYTLSAIDLSLIEKE